jgi:hypothetical protein
MASCERCNATVAPADTFMSMQGETLCRACNAAAQIATGDQRAAESFARENPGLKLAPPGAKPSNPIGIGLGLIGIAVAWLLVGVFVADKIYFYPMILGLVGFGAVARGLMLRRR